VLQVGEAAVAGAEVVKRYLTADLAQSREEPAGRGRVIDNRGLSDLERQQRRVDRGSADVGFDLAKQREVGERLGREVERDMPLAVRKPD